MQPSPILRVISCVALALFVSCSNKQSATAGSGGSLHGAAGAVPGSYEDWCSEHEVPESKCTRCDASLVAAFKATGDWCEEHGLPESQCVQCDPSRKMVRPAKTGEK